MTTMTADVSWISAQERPAFNAKTGSGHTITMDSQQNLGARPMEVLLSSLGSCASYDVVGILQKSRQNITDVQCQVTGTRADAIPAVFEKIHLHFVVTGVDIKESQVQKAISLSAEKYCSISRMLEQGGVQITHDYTIQNA